MADLPEADHRAVTSSLMMNVLIAEAEIQTGTIATSAMRKKKKKRLKHDIVRKLLDMLIANAVIG